MEDVVNTARLGGLDKSAGNLSQLEILNGTLHRTVSRLETTVDSLCAKLNMSPVFDVPQPAAPNSTTMVSPPNRLVQMIEEFNKLGVRLENAIDVLQSKLEIID